jgi:hypothetical protein
MDSVAFGFVIHQSFGHTVNFAGRQAKLTPKLGIRVSTEDCIHGYKGFTILWQLFTLILILRLPIELI